MKIIIAPDKFKTSLTAIQYCEIVEKTFKDVCPMVDVIKVPLADGGDGTIDILNYYFDGEIIKVSVLNPVFERVEASYLYIKKVETAYIELAEASGIKLLKINQQNCMYTSTFGTGELIGSAIRKGAKTIIVGIGGSATNDAGFGILSALGFKFKDENDLEFIPTGVDLIKVARIDSSGVSLNLKNIDFKIACDVKNPLYGKNGAAYVYAKQKGASSIEIEQLDKGLKHIANLFRKKYNLDIQDLEGAGAAGGVGAGMKALLDASLTSGIDLIKEMIGFESIIQDADLIITGEGNLDWQTLYGKTISGVLNSAKKYDIPVIAICGKSDITKEELNKIGISYTATIMDKANSLKDSIENSAKYLSIITSEIATKFACS